MVLSLIRQNCQAHDQSGPRLGASSGARPGQERPEAAQAYDEAGGSAAQEPADNGVVKSAPGPGMMVLWEVAR